MVAGNLMIVSVFMCFSRIVLPMTVQEVCHYKSVISAKNLYWIIVILGLLCGYIL